MSFPDHLFIASDGGLHDTRRDDWSRNPLRADYRYTFRDIRNVSQFKATLRNGAYAWPGGYPLFLLTDDGATLHFACARKEARNVMDSIQRKASDGWRVVACDVNWEDSDLCCDHCSKRIESAYGDDEGEAVA